MDWSLRPRDLASSPNGNSCQWYAQPSTKSTLCMPRTINGDHARRQVTYTCELGRAAKQKVPECFVSGSCATRGLEKTSTGPVFEKRPRAHRPERCS